MAILAIQIVLLLQRPLPLHLLLPIAEMQSPITGLFLQTKQWGSRQWTNSGFQTVTFPISFATTNYSVISNYGADSTNMYGQIMTSSKTLQDVSMKGYKAVFNDYCAVGY